MENRRPVSVQQQTLAYERQRRLDAIRQEKLKRRRRKRFIKKCILLACMLIILAFAVFLVVRLVGLAIDVISNATQTEVEDLPHDYPQLIYLPEPPKPEIVIKTAPDEPYPGGAYIDFYHAIDQVLPEPYSTADYEFYKNWEQDEPILSLDDGITIVIDAGHQIGTRLSSVWLSPYIDPADTENNWVMKSLLEIGATGVSTGVMEYTVTHTVADKLKVALEKEGYTVILSHENVEDQISGAERAAFANKNNADLMISLHCDAYKDSTARGCTAWAPQIWEGYPSERLAYLSVKAGEIIADEYAAATGFYNRGCKVMPRASMFAFCKVPIILFEMGYMSNPKDDEKLCNDGFQDIMVEGFVNGINKYFELIWD